MRHTVRNVPPLALLFLAIMMSWLSFSIFSGADSERLVEEQVLLGKIELDRLQAQIEHSYRNDELHWIQQSLASLGANNEILRMTLADADGQILADLNRSSLGMELTTTLRATNDEQENLQQTMLGSMSELKSGQIYRSKNEDFLGAVYPVTLVESGLQSQRGTIWMEKDIRLRKALAQEQIRLQTIALMIGFTFLALCLGILFHVIVTRRINKLVTTMSQVADGDLDARVSFTTKDEFGRLGRYFNDMLDRRQAVESALRQSQKLESIGTLASGIAHDFNNILQAISGYVRLAQSRADKDDSELSRYLEKIDLASTRATTLVQRILSFSRSTEADLNVVRLQQALEESLELLNSAISPSIRIHRNIDGACSPVLADPTQLQQVLTNLLTNAVQAVDQKTGVIDLCLREVTLNEPLSTLTGRLPPDRYVEFSIEDDGPGIPHEYLDRLFDPFFTTKEVGSGTGLGLSIVHGVVKQTRGGLLIDSEKTGGARIVVLLPIAKGAKAAMDDSTLELQSTETSSTHSNYRILLVDDEAEIVQSTALLLARRGYTVSIADGPTEALERVEEEAFDVAVLDYQMPGMNGVELATKVNEKIVLPVILATGMLPDSEIEKGIPRSVSRIIRKPYDIDTLDRLIIELVDA